MAGDTGKREDNADENEGNTAKVLEDCDSDAPPGRTSRWLASDQEVVGRDAHHEKRHHREARGTRHDKHDEDCSYPGSRKSDPASEDIQEIDQRKGNHGPVASSGRAGRLPVDSKHHHQGYEQRQGPPLVQPAVHRVSIARAYGKYVEPGIRTSPTLGRPSHLESGYSPSMRRARRPARLVRAVLQTVRYSHPFVLVASALVRGGWSVPLSILSDDQQRRLGAGEVIVLDTLPPKAGKPAHGGTALAIVRANRNGYGAFSLTIPGILATTRESPAPRFWSLTNNTLSSGMRWASALLVRISHEQVP